MNKNSEMLKNQMFWKSWRRVFSDTIKRAIISEIGIGLDKFRGGASPNTVVKRRTQQIIEQKKSLIKFNKTFLTLCRKNGFLHDDGKWEWGTRIDGIPKQVMLDCKRLALSLSDGFDDLNKALNDVHEQFGNQRRPRVPTEVAFQIARLLHAYKNDSSQIEILKKMFNVGGELDQLIQHISAEESKRLRVKDFEVKWNPFNAVRTLDNNWINRVKDQMIRTILFDGEPVIVKALSPKDRERKEALLKDLNQGRYINSRWEKERKEQWEEFKKFALSFKFE